MSHLSNQLHEDARRRFDDLGMSLLGRVATFRDTPAQARPHFSPDVFTDVTLTDANSAIVGDVDRRWKNSYGKLTGIAFPDGGGLHTGLIGPDYEELEALALSMAKVKPFHATASIQFLQSQIFEWIKERHRGHGSAGCVDHVLLELENAAAEHRMLFPVSELHVQSTFTLGSVTVSTFPESIFETIEPKLMDDPSAAERAEWCLSLRRDFQGLAVAETCVFGEEIRALEIARDRVELAVGVLRFFAPCHHVGSGLVSRVALWGHAPQRTNKVFFADAAGQFLRDVSAIADHPGTMVVSDDTLDILLNVGLSEVRDILGRDSRTDLEQALLTGLVTFGRAALTSDLREKIIWYCAGLESILLRNSSDSIIHNLSERLAVFGYDTVGERAAALKDVKKAYSLRSRFVHHGVEIGEGEIVTRFARHGLRLFTRITKNVASFNSKDEFLDHIDHMKLSGSSQ